MLGRLVIQVLDLVRNYLSPESRMDLLMCATKEPVTDITTARHSKVALMEPQQ